jgi:3-hydroxyisobutyrate dehydrogenase
MVMSGVAQSIRFAEALGVDPRLYLEAIDGGPVGAPYAQVKGKAILAGDYATAFAVDGVIKDIELMIDEAERASFPTPLLEAVRGLFVEAAGKGHGDDDMAAVAEAFTGS